MDRVTLLILGMVSLAPCACSAATGAEPIVISQRPQLQRWQQFVAEASRRFGVPQAWIYAVMDAESRGQTMLNGRPITSRVGAVGLMQLMPGTYEELRVEHALGRDPHDPRDNILAGTAYLRAMFDRFGFPGLFAAYNAGPDRYEAHLASGKPLPKETVWYLAKLSAAGVSATDMEQFKGKSPPARDLKVPSGRSLFFLKGGVAKRDSRADILVPVGPEQAGSGGPVGN
ncbi:lytic transglycosylase domain-containing protein [Mesorhizobium sp. M8A.F.Ca.ET.059.01.1.1]|nr:lytic transglycosylase domain-containing protein [Mesorhizobium sp. M8A.F.Ca.ET.059.01.1.1]